MASSCAYSLAVSIASSDDVPGLAEPADDAHPSASERALLARLVAGDGRAFRELVLAHHGLLVRLASTVVRTRAVADEVVQETWLAVIEGLPRFEGRSSLRTWITRILLNRARTRAVREARSTPASQLSESGEGTVDPSHFDADGRWRERPQPWEGWDSPEKLLLDDEARALIEAAIAELPETQRLVITMRDLHDLDADEVCNVLGIATTHQRVLLHRARTRVRDALARAHGRRP
jgi:RNA polymerase sigma-70 factor (ECF subfamily)